MLTRFVVERELAGRSEVLQRALVARQTTRAGVGQVTFDTGAPVAWLDVDACENRFLLAASGNTGGAISCCDLLPHTSGDPEPVFVARAGGSGSGGAVTAVQFCPYDSGAFFSASVDGFVRVWDSNAVSCVLELNLRGAVLAMSAAAVYGGRRLLLAVGGEFDERLRLCDVRAASAVHTLCGHGHTVYSVDWHPGNEWVLASASGDGNALLWDIRRSGVLARVGGGSIAFSSHRVTSPPVTTVRFSPDARFIFTFDREGVLRKYDAVTMVETLVNFPRMPR
jgi:WD40 repeat protein